MFNHSYSFCHSYNSTGAASITSFDPVAAGSGHHQPPLPSFLSSSFPPSDFLHRSSSTHSLPIPSRVPDTSNFLDYHTEPVRRVFSTGDLQCMNGSFASAEPPLPDAAASAAGRVGRYSAEERRERIERYRSKRNQRNFHKKITYACRKTLADSRPRVRGRFARNGEAEHETEVETESTECGFDSWNTYGLAEDGAGAATAGGNGDWWRQMQSALRTPDEEDRSYDEDIWASFDSVFAMNVSSSLS